MDLTAEILRFLQGFSPAQIGAVLLVLAAVVYLRRAGVAFSQLGFENRRLRRGMQNYARLEHEHRELSQEHRERNDFHAALPMLISGLAEERTLSGISRQLVDFPCRALRASQGAPLL